MLENNRSTESRQVSPALREVVLGFFMSVRSRGLTLYVQREMMRVYVMRTHINPTRNYPMLMYNSAAETLVTDSRALRDFATPRPMGRFHHTTPFADFAYQVEQQVQRAGFSLGMTEYAVSKDGNKMFGMIELEPMTGELITADEWRMQIGLRSSHDQSLPMGLTMGTRVMVCSNLAFSGALGNWRTKNTTEIAQRLPHIIADAVSRLPAMIQHEGARRDAYKLRELKPRHGDAALVEVYRRGGFTAAQLGTAIDQWHEPAHDDHAEDGYTVWRAFNAATQALKPTGVNNNMNLVRERSMIATSFFDEVVGL